MKRTYTLLFIFIFSFLFSFGQDAATAIDTYLKEKYPANEPGVIALVIKDGKTILRKGYGMADMETNKPQTPEMISRIGSVSKQFTSTAILKLMEEGKLKLDDPITKFLPDYPTQGKTVTVWNLLNHTSGIKSYTGIETNMTTENKAKNLTHVQLLETFQNIPYDFNPGDRWMYNNSGYYLLGMIIEKVSGMSWDEYLTKNFFKPLKMKSTVTDDTKLKSGEAIGYYKDGDNFKVADFVHPSIPYAAGSIASTVDDLWKWNNAIFNYKVVSQSSLEQAWTPTKLNDGTLESYGFGWSISRVGNQKAISHGGGIDGYLTYVLYIPESKVFVAMLSNNNNNGPTEYAYHAAQVASGQSLEKPAPITMDVAAMKEYVGVYSIDPTQDRVIRLDGNRLTSQRTGSSVLPIYPYAIDKFYFDGSPSLLFFNRDDAGKIKSMELVATSWVNSVATKTDKPIPDPRVEIEMDPAELDKFVGEYELVPGFVLTFRREGDKLMSQATGQQAFQVFPESTTKFFFKVVDAQVEFTSDAEGNVNSVTLFQGGRVMPAKRIN